MNNALISKVETEFNAKRTRAKIEYDFLLASLLKEHPALDALFAKRRHVVSDFSCGKEARKQAIKHTDCEIAAYLSANGITMPSLKHDCDICSDQGFVEQDGKKERCACFTRRLIELSSNGCYANVEQNFDTFDLSVFENEQQASIKKLYDYSRQYCDKFPCVKRKNMIFSGKTGTGKTFFLNSICYALRARGFSVIFITAGRLFEILRKYAFSEEVGFDSLLQADMLIIDDLGSEPLFNNITIEYLFMLINERTQLNKAICISTNLTPDQLAQRYTDRIASRLFDETNSYVFNLLGKDLRLRK